MIRCSHVTESTSDSGVSYFYCLAPATHGLDGNVYCLRHLNENTSRRNVLALLGS